MSYDGAVWWEERQQDLRALLIGTWADDVWLFDRPRSNGPLTKGKARGKARWCFTCTSPALNIELKYACWSKIESGMWRRVDVYLCRSLRHICAWLNVVAPSTQSLLSKELGAWETSLRSYLVREDHYRPTHKKHLTASQEYVVQDEEDLTIRLLRRIYRIITEAYADPGQRETDKDIWDMRVLGFRLNPSRMGYSLNFTPISQPWLRAMAKRFILYNGALYSGANCSDKLGSLKVFSRFLVAEREQFGHVHGAAQIDRALVVGYMSYLEQRVRRVLRRNFILGDLRTFLKTCAYELQMDGVPKADLIFNADFPKADRALVEEIPSEVLIQMREHLDDLPTVILRMLVVNLACGMRIGELCTLSHGCISQDSKGQWTLFCYQSKLKKEHAIPIVDNDIIATMQAQQEAVAVCTGPGPTFLFPHPRLQGKGYPPNTFNYRVNEWIVKHDIRTRTGTLYRFKSHTVRHTVAMGWLREGVSLDTIRRLLGHTSVMMTQRYAYRQQSEARAELEQMLRRHVTLDATLLPNAPDQRAEDVDVQLLHQGLNSAVLPVGSCGRLRVLGPCEHLNKCFDCPLWRTSPSDVPQLETLARRNRKLLPMARLTNKCLLENIDRDLRLLEARITKHKELWSEGSISLEQERAAYRRQLQEAEAGLSEAEQNGLWLAVQACQQSIRYLRGKIATLEHEGTSSDE
jgi:integrase